MLTAEQTAIIEAARDTRAHIVINALAGTGKTTTLLEVISVLNGTTLLNAFNRSIADELRRKAAAKFDMMTMSSLNVATVHSHGLKAFSRAGQRAKTDSGKCAYMLKDMLTGRYGNDHPIWKNMGKVTRLVGAAKSAGFGLSSDFEQFPLIDSAADWLDLADHYNIEDELTGNLELDMIIDLSMKLLKASNLRRNMIDFDDMIYLPLLDDLPFVGYDNVLIDEAQDINATRRELAFRSIKPGGRIIAVGDPNQAIYGFTGADVESLANIERRAGPSTLTFPLTVCWRCDNEIIASAQQQVPEIKARPNADDGQVLNIDFVGDRFLDMPAPGDAILCRINKPNVAVCLGLLRRGVRAKIEGRDLGKKLEQHVQKANPLYASQPLETTLDCLEVHRQQEVEKLVNKNKPESAITMLEDEIEAAALIIERCLDDNLLATYADFSAKITDLFGDDVSKAYVTLSSIHKSKGREWKRVFILGPDDWMPHPMAKKAWEKGQEQNLIYVAKTRAEKTLVMVLGAKGAIDAGEHRHAPAKKETVA